MHNAHLPIPLNIEKPNVYVRQFKPAIEINYKELFWKIYYWGYRIILFFCKKDINCGETL